MGTRYIQLVLYILFVIKVFPIRKANHCIFTLFCNTIINRYVQNVYFSFVVFCHREKVVKTSQSVFFC